MSFPTVHRVGAESFPSIYTAALHLLTIRRANPGDIIIMMRGRIELARGEVSALASLAVSSSDRGRPPSLMRYNHEEKMAS